MKSFIKNIIAHPAFIAVAVLVTVLFFTEPSDLNFITETVGGAIVIKTITALVAVIVLLLSVRLAVWAHVLFKNGEPDHVTKTNPVAMAVLRGFIYLAVAIVVASVF